MPIPCHVFIRWHCHYLFVPALVWGTLPFLLSSGEFIHVFGYLGFFCSFNVKTIKEGENGLFIYLYFYSQGCLLSLGKYIWVIDQVWGQDGWILAKFFFCVFMDRDGVEVHKLAKKERGQYPAILTEQAWSIKDLLYGFRGNFSCGTRRVVPSGQDSSILPARVANHSAGFDSSCPLAELAI